jgi:hypothetical protein
MRVWIKRSCHRVLWVIIVTALIPLPVVAGDTPTDKRAPSLKESAAQIVARGVAAAPARPSATRDARQGSASTNSPSFFKSRPGMIALAVMAAGTGYAIYSAQHDRIHSPGKQ